MAWRPAAAIGAAAWVHLRAPAGYVAQQALAYSAVSAADSARSGAARLVG